MTAEKSDAPAGLVQGTLDMLVLRVLALEPLHGYGIAVRIEQVSRGVFDVNPGSLFPAFRRLEDDRDYGSIAPGKSADIIAVEGDGLADISRYTNVAFVMKTGTVYKAP